MLRRTGKSHEFFSEMNEIRVKQQASQKKENQDKSNISIFKEIPYVESSNNTPRSKNG